MARKLSVKVRKRAVPYLCKLAAADKDELVAAVKQSAGYEQDLGKARVIVILAQSGCGDMARAFVGEREAALDGRTDAAAEQERDMLDRAREWLATLDIK